MTKRIIFSLFVSGFFAVLSVDNASAQAQRTFVSGLGSDSNPCSRTAPCRGITQALLGTNTSGEVIVLDSAGYGAFVITKAVSIIAPPGVYAGVSVFSGDGIDINAGGSDTVILRGLTINNQGSNGTGIVFNTGATLHVQGCAINGFSSGDGVHAGNGGTLSVTDTDVRGCGIGIEVDALSANGNLVVHDSRISACGSFGVLLDAVASFPVTGLMSNCTTSSCSSGIVLAADSSANASMTLTNCRAFDNINHGVVAQADNTGTVTLMAANCQATGNGGTGFRALAASSGPANMSLTNCQAVGDGIAILSRTNSSGPCTVRIANCIVQNNTTGISVVGSGTVIGTSPGTNLIADNGSGNTTTSSATLQ